MPVCGAIVALAVEEEEEAGAFATSGENGLLCAREDLDEEGMVRHSTISSTCSGCIAHLLPEIKWRCDQNTKLCLLDVCKGPLPLFLCLPGVGGIYCFRAHGVTVLTRRRLRFEESNIKVALSQR